MGPSAPTAIIPRTPTSRRRSFSKINHDGTDGRGKLAIVYRWPLSYSIYKKKRNNNNKSNPDLVKVHFRRKITDFNCTISWFHWIYVSRFSQDRGFFWLYILVWLLFTEPGTSLLHVTIVFFYCIESTETLSCSM